MHFNSIPAVAALLGLAAPGVLSGVIPQAREVGPSSGLFAHEVIEDLCIKDFCTAVSDGKQVTQQCGSFVLTVTQFDSPPPSGDCIGHFHSLIHKDTSGNSSQTGDALYEVSVQEDNKANANKKRKNKTGKTGATPTIKNSPTVSKSASSEHKSPSVTPTTTQNSASKPSSSSQAASKTSPSGSSVIKSSVGSSSTGHLSRTSQNSTPASITGRSSSGSSSTPTGSHVSSSTPSGSHISASTPSGSHISASTPSGSHISASTPSGSHISASTPSGSHISASTSSGSHISSSTPSDSQITSTRSRSEASTEPTGSKTSASATPSASACSQASNGKARRADNGKCPDDTFYERDELIPGKATHWKFNTRDGYKDYNADAKAKAVLSSMKEKGQLDVVKIVTGDLTVMGEIIDPDLLRSRQGTDPYSFTKKGDNYILVNGGFYDNKITSSRAYEPVGKDTKVKSNTGKVQRFDNPYDFPEQFKDFYTVINGLEDTKVYSGPNLQQTIPGIDDASGVWKYEQGDSDKVGYLSHASQANERIALVRFDKTYYTMAYTCENRACGVTTNELKTIIDKFFSEIEEDHKTISSSTQAICLDGGQSISMIWNKGTEQMKKLSIGEKGDETPSEGTDPKKVSNLIKIVAN